MSSIAAKWLLMLAAARITLLQCQVYPERATIKASDGDLILQPAQGHNVYLRPNGARSSVFVGNVNVLQQNAPRDDPQQPATSEQLEEYLNGPNGVLQRLQALENKALPSPDSTLLNVTELLTKINTLNKKATALQKQINNRPRGECDSQPCRHGGTCLDLVDGYYCLCPANWEGRDCDVDVDECRNFAGTELGCQNGATCVNEPGAYACDCKPTWMGVHCTTKAKDCSAGDFEMCGYGTCIPVTSGEGITCICHQGWRTNGTGAACLTDVNECESSEGPRCSVNPAVECVNVAGSFRCGRCPAGYEGDGYVCNDIDECTFVPNGGCSPLVTCHNTIGSRVCGSCPPGYRGDGVTCTFVGSCNINHGGCHSSAECAELPSPTGVTVQCVCPEGMDGDGVGFAGCYVPATNYTTACGGNPCGSHGRCHLVRSGYTCICYKGYGGAHCDTPTDGCAANPCQNGGVCRQDALSGLHCECAAQYSGSLCQVRSSTCGGILNAEQGSIAFPLSNTTTYDNNAQCAWLILTEPDKVLNVTFSKFIVESSPECSADFLQLHDGRKSSSQLIGRFCGDALPKGGNIVSNHNSLYLWFHSDGTVAKDGFALHWNSVKPACGGEVDVSTHGHLSSPGSPGPYPPNRDCYWHLVAPPAKRIALHFFGVDIEVHDNCTFDYLAIYDGEHTTDPLLSRYCSSTQPAPVHSASSHMLIHFHSDAYGSGNGFQIAYAPIEGIPSCGGYFSADRGELVAPTYDGLYLSNLLCEYQIKTSAGTKIKIHFQLFHVESSPRCKNDYLKIYDGPSADSQLVGKFCGTAHPATYTSTSNTLYFKFRTDRTEAAEGFRISYEAICEKSIAGDSGIITSPSYPLTYPENKVCVYVIGTEPGKAIQLTFQDFDIEESRYDECQYDYVEIRDGADINATLLGRFCGGPERMPAALTSTHNYMYVRFQSDVSISGAGFYANYTTIDIECGGIYRNTTGLITYLSEDTEGYDPEKTCRWLLLAPEGERIKVTWNRFAIQKSDNCSGDYLRVTEINHDNENYELGQYCGTSAPPAFTSATNRLELIFVSDDESHVQYGGFSLSYTFLDERTHCGGNYIGAHGYIRSPGWPQPYEPNRDCTWTITAPAGQQIALNITHFRLEHPLTQNLCNYVDYLEIRNGGSDTSTLIGKYCGEFIPKRITSLTNMLFLRFHSDFAYGGTGFSIEWDSTITGCGGTLTSSTGSITSPNYPNNYHDNAECFYKIVTNAGSRIRIAFTMLDFEMSHDCHDDYVEIFDGRDTNAPSFGKHCVMSPVLTNIVTTKNYALIKFRSDYMQGGKGFVLNYLSVCNNNITGRYGVIESPDYPNQYPLNTKCSWNIQVPKGNRINVTFTHFDILDDYVPPRWMRRHPWHRHSFSILDDSDFVYPRSPSGYDSFDDYNDVSLGVHCSNTYLRMKENSEEAFPKKFCGSSFPSSISTKGNSLQIEFSSGSFRSGTGFRLEWVSYGCGGHIARQSGSVALDKSLTTQKEMECEWLIETLPGKSVSITFTDIYMSESNNCTTDALEIYNGQDTKAPLLSKICHQTHVTIESDSNYMLVRFVKLSTLRDVHFTSQFRTSKAKCGGLINSMSGFLYSNNYPKNYDNNEDCIWYITVPVNHRIEINFIDLDLYSNSYGGISDDDECGDSILIYDDNNYSPSSNYSYRICPSSNKRQVVTKYHHAVVQFKSDGAGTAKGFRAKFSATCGAVISATHEDIITNNNYMNQLNKSCTWTIIAPRPDQKISLTLTHMSLPRDGEVITNRHCPSVYVRVLDGDDEKAPLIGEYCGRKVPPTIVSRGSAITILLASYTDMVAGHFSAHYSPILNACGGTLTAEEGTIASPSYPAGADCEWLLSTSPGNTAYVTFELFDLEDSESCDEDYLELRESHSGGKLLGVYCGAQVPSNCTIDDKLYIKFHSSSRTSGRGFVLNYGYLHENNVHGEFGQITSPLYPIPYEGAGEYTWRILNPGTDSVTLRVDHLEIPSRTDAVYNTLTIYDGYEDTAPILAQMYGVIDEKKIIDSSSSAVYISLTLDESNTGSIFQISWTQSSRSEHSSTSEERVNCGANHTELLLPGQTSVVQSPNYPNFYKNDLNCEWIYRTKMDAHLSITFTDVHLESSDECFADFIAIYSADSPGDWQQVEKVCSLTNTNREIDASTYMKVKFISDSSVTSKGFLAEIRSKCGGLLTDRSGEIEPTWSDAYANNNVKCNWTIKARPGHTIKLRFTHFNITNNNEHCDTYVVLRNGDSAEAPLLASGKYCGYEQENKLDIETSSNALFVSYTSGGHSGQVTFYSFKIYYEEANYECGSTSKLTADHKWEVISSPNYPSVPAPYSECVWVFTGPPGEVLRIDFIDRFDLDDSDDCGTEVVEVYDGSSSLSPSKGRFCGEKPGTIKTSGNTVYLKYSNQLTMPRTGFKANVSIDVCGGTIIAESGVLKSPGYPHMQEFPYGTVCEWHIIGPPDHTFLITPKDVRLPHYQSLCSTKIDIEETIPGNNTVSTLKTICDNDVEGDIAATESSGNRFTIKLTYGKSDDWAEVSQKRGFRINYSSSKQMCGGLITSPEGYITTPNYPQETTLTHCRWQIRIPNRSRRIRLEVIDTNSDKHTLTIMNNFNYFYVIVSSNVTSASGTQIYESVADQLSVTVSRRDEVASYRFKAKFSSDEPALCGGDLSLVTRELLTPDLPSLYSCKWHYNAKLAASGDNDLIYNSIFMSVDVNSSITRSLCRYSDPKILIITPIGNSGEYFQREACANGHVAFRIPSIVFDITAIKMKRQPFYFHLNWKLQPCGGTVHVGTNPINVLNVPDSYNDTVDCSWILIAPDNNGIEIKIEGSFLLNCDDEYVTVTHGADQDTPAIGRYCKGQSMTNSLVTNFNYIYIEYHSKVKSHTDLKLMANTLTNQCGGLLRSFPGTFTSPNYPKSYIANEECVWEIHADLGYRVSLQFVDRFVVEASVNCTKDVIIIYNWKDEAYKEMARVCGRATPPLYNSTYNRLKVVFRTDAETNLDGFKAQWTTICGGHYVATDKQQTLYSPGYPYKYRNNMDCSYSLSAPNSGNSILVQFHDFVLAGNPPVCDSDNLTIEAFDKHEHFYDIFCGSKTPSVLPTYATINLNYKTGEYIQSKGFKLSYSIYKCGGRVNESTVISSSFGDDNYDDEMNCTWIIEAPPNKVVVVKFFYIDMEVHGSCVYDNVALYDGLNIDKNKRLAVLCGYINSTTVLTSTGSGMVVQFISDVTGHRKGFKAAIYFSYSAAAGCGGQIELAANSSHALKSPLISNVVYENLLDCRWSITSPADTVIRITFSKFHIAPCKNINQTAVGYSKCDCDLVEVKDGLSLNSFDIGTYCGHALPPQLTTSGNMMSVRLSTDGELVSSGFEAILTVHQTLCGESVIPIDISPHRFKSPGYDVGSIPRGLHCVYHVQPSNTVFIRITIYNLELRPPITDSANVSRCVDDRLVISSTPSSQTNGDQILNHFDNIFETFYFYQTSVQYPTSVKLCGHKETVDIYVFGRITINLITSSETDDGIYRGVDIEVAVVGFCDRNHTASQGRIHTSYEVTSGDYDDDCYTLITAPENYTISAYFLEAYGVYSIDNDTYLDIFDGDKTSAKRLARISGRYDNNPVFSTGKYMLLHSHVYMARRMIYDMNYVTTNKGVGCGGKLSNMIGAVTSPFYPNTYRHNAVCEWVLETPLGTRLMIRFSVFDLGDDCETNYLELVDSKGVVMRSFCDEAPADYTSDDHYVKLVFHTTMNNSGRGWSALFVGTNV